MPEATKIISELHKDGKNKTVAPISVSSFGV